MDRTASAFLTHIQVSGLLLSQEAEFKEELVAFGELRDTVKN